MESATSIGDRKKRRNDDDGSRENRRKEVPDDKLIREAGNAVRVVRPR